MGRALPALGSALVIAGCAAPPLGTEGRARRDRAHRRDLRREPQLRPSLRPVPRRQRASPNATPAQYTQLDRDGKPLAELPPAWKGKDPTRRFRTAAEPAVPHRRAAGQPAAVAAGAKPRAPLLPEPRADQRRRNDLLRRDVGCRRLAMGYYDGSSLPMWQWAREYTLADNFFMGAYGGSFLNHFWLVCACTPRDEHAPAALRAQVDERG